MNDAFDTQKYKGQMLGTRDDGLTSYVRTEYDGDLSVSLSDANGHNVFSTIFGDLIIGNRIPILATAFNNGIPLDQFEVDLSGSTIYEIEHVDIAGEDYSTNVGMLSSGTTANSSGFVKTLRRLRYLPGHESYAYFTAKFENIDDQSTAFIGLFDSEEGYSIGYNQGQFCYRRQRLDSELIVPISEFNGGYDVDSIDFSMLNIFAIKFGYLGIAPIEIYIFDGEHSLTEDGKVQGMGKFKLLHQEKYTGTSNKPHVYNANLPMASYVDNGLSTNNVRIGSASLEIGNINGHLCTTDPTSRDGVFTRDAVSVNGTDVEFVAFRNPLSATMYRSINATGATTNDEFKNTVAALLKTVKVIGDGAGAGTMKLYTITDDNITNIPTWTSVNDFNNVIDYSTDITVNLTNARLLNAFVIPKDGFTREDVRAENYLLFPGQYAIFVATVNNSTVTFVNTWDEQF